MIFIGFKCFTHFSIFFFFLNDLGKRHIKEIHYFSLLYVTNIFLLFNFVVLNKVDHI